MNAFKIKYLHVYSINTHFILSEYVRKVLQLLNLMRIELWLLFLSYEKAYSKRRKDSLHCNSNTITLLSTSYSE
jgi:hypothetical protein